MTPPPAAVVVMLALPIGEGWAAASTADDGAADDD
jgi:hypothetical protein